MNSAMPRDQDPNEQFEWVNAWAASTRTNIVPAEREPLVSNAAPEVSDATSPHAVPAQPAPQDQLARDVAEIERTRDALAALPVGIFLARRRTQALTLVPSRTSDPVPVVIGGVLALVMLTVFGAAAAMTKFSR
jgi:hypothetical protein